MEKKLQTSAVELRVGIGVSTQHKWKQINFSFSVKTVEYFYIEVFRNQTSVNCVINIKDDPIHFACN